MSFKVSLLLVISLHILSCSPPEPSYFDYTPIDTSQPVQTTADHYDIIVIDKGGDSFVLTPQADYIIGAVVAGKKRYRDDMSPISPYDLSLVWGVMAYPEFRKQVTIRHNRRRYFFFPKRSATISADWIYLNSSNNHIIPANDNIRRALAHVKKNDVILLEGYLVYVRAHIRGYSTNWNSSLQRDDRGDGSCEIIYVTRLKRNYKVYE